MSIRLSVQERLNIYFKDGVHLGFPIGRILAIFEVQVTLMLPSKFQVSYWSFSSGEEAKNRFQHVDYLGFLTRTILAIFDLQVTLMLPTKFYVDLPFSSGEEAKNRL